MIVVVVMFKMEQELNCVKQLHTMHLVNLLTLARGKGTRGGYNEGNRKNRPHFVTMVGLFFSPLPSSPGIMVCVFGRVIK